MTDNSFDNFIKEKLDNYSSPVPGGMWEKLQLEKDKKRRGFYWWKQGGFLLAGITIAVLFGWLLITKNDEKVAIAEIEKANIKRQDNNKEVKKQVPQSLKAGEVKKSTNNADKTVNTQTNADLSTTANNTSRTDDVKNSLLATSSVNSNQNKNYLGNFQKDFKISDKKRAIRQQSNLAGLTTENENSFGRNDIDKSNNVLVDEATNSTFRFPASTLLAEKEMRLLNNYNPVNLSTLNKLNTSIIDCPPNRLPVRNDVYVEFFASPDYSIKAINKGNSDEAYLRRKDSSESRMVSFTAGIRLTKFIGENLYLKSGLQYSQINEKFSFKSDNERKLTTVITTRIIIRSSGDTVYLRDTSVVEQIGFKQKTTYNKYRSIDIPVMFGYEWGGESWKAAITAGAIINLSSWQQGEILDTTNNPVAFGKNQATIFKKNVGIGLYGGFSFIKSISANTEIFAEPYFRYNLSSITNGTTPYNQKFHLAGLNLGIRLKLNR